MSEIERLRIIFKDFNLSDDELPPIPCPYKKTDSRCSADFDCVQQSYRNIEGPGLTYKICCAYPESSNYHTSWINEEYEKLIDERRRKKIKERWDKAIEEMNNGKYKDSILFGLHRQTKKEIENV